MPWNELEKNQPLKKGIQVFGFFANNFTSLRQDKESVEAQYFRTVLPMQEGKMSLLSVATPRSQYRYH